MASKQTKINFNFIPTPVVTLMEAVLTSLRNKHDNVRLAIVNKDFPGKEEFVKEVADIKRLTRSYDLFMDLPVKDRRKLMEQFFIMEPIDLDSKSDSGEEPGHSSSTASNRKRTRSSMDDDALSTSSKRSRVEDIDSLVAKKVGEALENLSASLVEKVTKTLAEATKANKENQEQIKTGNMREPLARPNIDKDTVEEDINTFRKIIAATPRLPPNARNCNCPSCQKCRARNHGLLKRARLNLDLQCACNSCRAHQIAQIEASVAEYYCCIYNKDLFKKRYPNKRILTTDGRGNPRDDFVPPTINALESIPYALGEEEAEARRAAGQKRG